MLPRNHLHHYCCQQLVLPLIQKPSQPAKLHSTQLSSTPTKPRPINASTPNATPTNPRLRLLQPTQPPTDPDERIRREGERALDARKSTTNELRHRTQPRARGESPNSESFQARTAICMNMNIGICGVLLDLGHRRWTGLIGLAGIGMVLALAFVYGIIDCSHCVYSGGIDSLLKFNENFHCNLRHAAVPRDLSRRSLGRWSETCLFFKTSRGLILFPTC